MNNMNTKFAFHLVVEEAIRRGNFHSCINCVHWSLNNDNCDKYRMRPPAKVIVYSCGKDWEDEIPF